MKHEQINNQKYTKENSIDTYQAAPRIDNPSAIAIPRYTQVTGSIQ